MDVLTKTTLLYLLLLLIKKSSSLDNGLALTPPMGWMSWERFRCVTDCENDPRNCISERLYIEMADAMVYGGFREAGYRYVCIDDCWTAMNRTKDGRLQADPKRFPSGIKWLADYVHARGLKLGIYADYGTKTCEGYPGSIKHIETDAQTFAEWGVDYLKLDGCYANPPKMDEGYPKFTRALNKTGRPIVFSCSWPAYQVFMNITPNYEKIAKHCNLWRNYGDIQDSFKSVVDIFSWFGDNQDDLIPAAGKGHWNDPDMLIVGNFGLSYEQSKLQFALWAIMASPLLMSNDLRDIDSRSKEILLNREIIDVNQDSLGKQGKRVVKNETSFTEIWFRPLSVCCSVSVALLSLRSDLPVIVEASFNDVGISTKRAYARDLFAHQELGIFEKSIKAKVNPSGVVMVKLTPICDSPEISAKKTSKKKKEKAEESKKTEKAKGEKTKEESNKKKKKGKMTEKESGEKFEKRAQEKSKKPKKKKGEETKEESEKKKKERKKSEKEPKKSEKKEGEKAKEESKKSKKEKGVKAKKESKKEKNEGKENKEELEKKSEKAKEESKETNKKKSEETVEKSVNVKKTVKKEGEKTEEESKKTAKRNSEETDSEEKPGNKKVEKTGKEHKKFSEKVNERDKRKRCHCCVRPVARN